MAAITTKVICLAPSTDATFGDSPLSKRRFIFSRTTIESSTINPIASTNARKVKTFKEYPRTYITYNVDISDTGIVIAGINVAEAVDRKKYITPITISIDMKSAKLTSDIDSSTNID